MASSASKIKLNTFNDLFGGNKEVENGTPFTEIALTELHGFKNHPFKVLDNEQMEDLAESIKEHGVLTPAVARPRAEGGYELLSGHRRRRACEIAGLDTMPVFVRECTDDEAVLYMVDANIQREEILPSEKARAYKMKYEARMHQGSKGNGRTINELGESVGESGKTVQRYIWLSRLSDELLTMVDNKKLGFVQGTDISFLNEEQQQWVEVILQEQNVAVTTAQSGKLKEYGKSNELTLPMVRLILTVEKPKERKVTLKNDRIRQYFTEDYSSTDIENIIFELLDEWQKNQ